VNFGFSTNTSRKIKVDMHVHSIYSERPVDGPLSYIGCMESYTDPETIYRKCKQQGMDLVTITDHNRIDGVMELIANYPEDVITGVEATTYFPEDGCKIHLLIYGFTPAQFQTINALRKNIYDLRGYLVHENLMHSVAHANSVVDNSLLNQEHIEKLLVLFNHFEVVNGSTNLNRNRSLLKMLEDLRIQPELVYKLADKYGIETAGDIPWIKSMLGGSDDHAGLFIGRTYTEFSLDEGADFFSAFRNGQSKGYGWQCIGHWWAVTIFFVGLKFISNEILLTKRGYTLLPIM